MSESGIPAEIVLSRGLYSDVLACYDFSLQILNGIVIVVNKACNAYSLDDISDKIRYSSDAYQKEKFKKKIQQFC